MYHLFQAFEVEAEWRKIWIFVHENLKNLKKVPKVCIFAIQLFWRFNSIKLKKGKEQADLLEWNHEKKSEANLKEILYLKSLKKFAINSLHEKFLMQETAYLNEYYKSLESENKKSHNELAENGEKSS